VDKLSFIAKVLEVTAWPVATVALVVMLRKEIAALLPSVRKLKAGPLEAVFERKTEELAINLETQPNAREVLADQRPTPPELTYTPGESPRSAILEAWLRVEEEAHDALGRHATMTGGPGAMTSRPSPRRLAAALRQSGLLNEGQVRLVEELRQLRNEVVHAREFTPTREAIARYLDSAKYLANWLSEAAR
jgi:hypothetical protein